MADVNEPVVVNNENGQAQAQAPELPQEVRDMMEMSLNGGMPKNLPSQEQQQTETTTAAEPVAGQAQEQTTVTDIFAPFKEKFGYQSPEDAIKEIEELRAYRQTPQELKFENDQSKVLFEAIKAGKTKEVFQVLAQQERLDSLTSLEVNKDTAADIIKLGMQLEYKDLTADEINYKFGKQFQYPKEPTQNMDETDDEFAMRKGEWQEQVRDIDMMKVIEAKLAKPKLEAAKVNIKLPEIENSVDEDYIQWQKSLEDAPKVAAQTKEAYQAIKPDSLKTKIGFNDEANKIAFDFEFEPDAESFNTTVQLLSDGDLFSKEYDVAEGKSGREKFLRDLYYGRNIQKVLTEAMKQTKNATIKAKLPDNSGNSGMNRQGVETTEPSELDQQMKYSLGLFNRR